MKEKLEHLCSLGHDYAATLAVLARDEARVDTATLARALFVAGLGIGAALLGVVWLNVALLLMLLRSPYPIAGALLIGLVAVIGGVLALSAARRRLGALQVMGATRRAIGETFSDEPPVRAIADPTPAVLQPDGRAQTDRRLRTIRQAIREEVRELRLGVPSVGAGAAERLGPDGAPYLPRSRTMRLLLWAWDALPRVPSGTALAGTVSVLALSSPMLRRLVALLALARNLGGNTRHPGSTPG